MADKETVVTTDGGGGAGLIIALVLAVVLLIGGFLLYQNGVFSGRAQDIKADVDVNVPAKTN